MGGMLERSMVKPAETNHFLTLDFLRGVAALAVTFFHLSYLGGGRWFGSVYLAVDFFFVLSGFVIANAYEQSLRYRNTMRRFLVTRAIRLYPVIFLGLAIEAARRIFAVLVMHGEPLTDEFYLAFVANAFVIPIPVDIQLHNTAVFPLNFPLWSLFFEGLANLAYAACLARMRTRYLLLIVALTAAAMIVWHGFIVSDHTIDGGSEHNDFYAGFPRVLFGFCIGVLLYRWRQAGRFPKTSAGPLALSLVLIAAVAPPTYFWGLAGDLAIVGIVFPIIVVLGINHRPKGVAARASEMLGGLSYPLYVLHMPMALACLRLISALSLHPENPGGAFVIAIVALMIVGAGIALVIYDKPIRAWLSRLASSRGGSASASAA